MAREFRAGKTQLMGILNVTPDSFYDGGRSFGPESALRRAERLAEEGADILDIGGESTRPGARPVALEEECRRVLPVIRRAARAFPSIPVSIDTRRAETARRALLEGARIINDISALAHDPAMAGLAARSGCRVVLMHMRGTPATMQSLARYRDVTREVRGEILERVEHALKSGVKKKNILIDPGIGFSKTAEQNLELLADLGSFSALGYPVMVGCSRKSFIGAVLGGRSGPLPPAERLEGSLACALWCASHGARVLRVHDVGATRRALRVAEALTA
ncbi:MAG: dihydropteroate synthase [Elusimicrobia bacterium RIFCSPLOWO2_01_FULL_64_13]|nr:MAG: dihydropteroate synthase [Elusimicrobia bacterium RIFCSPLOWO2_01_FULL_64_13]